MKQRITKIEYHNPDQYLGAIHVHAKIDDQEYVILYPKKPAYKEVLSYLVDKMNGKE